MLYSHREKLLSTLERGCLFFRFKYAVGCTIRIGPLRWQNDNAIALFRRISVNSGKAQESYCNRYPRCPGYPATFYYVPERKKCESCNDNNAHSYRLGVRWMLRRDKSCSDCYKDKCNDKYKPEIACSNRCSAQGKYLVL